jgi:hypothetical protein
VGIWLFCCCPIWGTGGAYIVALELETVLCDCWKALFGGLERGDAIRGGAEPLGGGGGGVGAPLGPPNGGALGGMTRFCWLGNGEVIGAWAGVPLLDIAGFVTIGVSFQLTISLEREGGAAVGVEFMFLGGPTGAPKFG